MGFTTGDVPPVEVDSFLEKPFLERMRTLALHWGEFGFGTAKMIHTVYVVKLLVLYVGVGTSLAAWTSDLGPVWDAGWWDEPVIYQKLILWTMLLEIAGLAGAWGPLSGHFKPMTGGARYWARTGTIRLRPWKVVPFTSGDTRTILDVTLYLGVLGLLTAGVLAPGQDVAAVAQALPSVEGGLVHPALLAVPIVLMVLIGLRDKVVFIAARSEQYLPALFFGAVLGPVDLVIALKLLIVSVWIGAGISKFGRHFSNVVPPMVSNSPLVLSKRFKRLQYRDFPTDLRPSRAASGLAHIGGTVVEIVTPLVLLFSTDRTVTLLAIGLMVCFHLFIISTFPLAVPLEWNLIFAYGAIFLFAGFPAQDGFALGDMSSPLLTVALLAALFTFPVLGNLRPDLVSFLPSMRQYAGNWASALWAFAPGAEAKLDAVPRPAGNQVDQLVAFGYEPKLAELTMQQTVAWRSMHSQGRGLLSLLVRHVPDLDRWTVREAEFSCNSIVGFNFGDGHLHDEDLIRAVQAHCQFAPGEFIVVWVESQPIHKQTQQYKVIDAALGVVERGTWKVEDAVDEQPWLPNGPIPTEVTWSRDSMPLPTMRTDDGAQAVLPA
ncbi:MAG: Transrane protein of uncharacterized function [Frankiales bacterium]|nr:Transrane protein of uncharacterized function [Frankiales bacterium]